MKNRDIKKATLKYSLTFARLDCTINSSKSIFATKSYPWSFCWQCAIARFWSCSPFGVGRRKKFHGISKTYNGNDMQLCYFNKELITVDTKADIDKRFRFDVLLWVVILLIRIVKTNRVSSFTKNTEEFKLSTYNFLTLNIDFDISNLCCQ